MDLYPIDIDHQLYGLLSGKLYIYICTKYPTTTVNMDVIN